MENNEIRYRLDLLLRLLDTTTGQIVTERDVRIFRDGNVTRPISRGNGNYVFLNIDREDSFMEIRVFGYEDAFIQVRYEELDEHLPIKDVFLIPSENTARGEQLLSLTGQLSKLEAIEAVRLGRATCSVKKFDSRKCIMDLFRTNGPSMEETSYGLLHTDDMTFEAFEVEKVISPVSLKLKKPLQEEFRENAPIARIVYGQCGKDGSYLLRVRDDAASVKYLIRYVVNGTPKYQVVDFHNPEEMQLR